MQTSKGPTEIIPASTVSAFGKVDWIRKLGKKHGWTQVEFAERVEIDWSFLADVERGKRNVSILNLELIAKGLKVSLSQLFSRL